MKWNIVYRVFVYEYECEIPVVITELKSFFFYIWLCPWHSKVSRPGIKPMPLQWPEPQQWRCWVLNPVNHQETLRFHILKVAKKLLRFSLYGVGEAVGKIHVQTLSVKTVTISLKSNLAIPMKTRTCVLSATKVLWFFL